MRTGRQYFMLLALCLLVLARLPVGATTQMDVLVVFDNTATNWVASNGGMAVFAENAVAKMNLALTNSNIDAEFRLVHYGSVNYTHSQAAVYTNVDLEPDLTGLQQGTGNLSQAHTWRDQYGADLVAMFVDTGFHYGIVGLGYVLGTTNGSPQSAFTVNAIQSVANSHTMTHEVGHNLGGDHAINQASSPGPNTNLNTYSAGWYFTGSDTVKYHTIMAYNNDGYGNSYTEAPLFSTPLINWQGTAAGHVADGDNARTIRETMEAVAGYRIPPVTVPYSEGFENGGTRPAGWTENYVVSFVDWSFRAGGPEGTNPGAAYNGSYNAAFGFHNTGFKTKLISPVLDFGANTNDAELTFWHYMQNWAGDQDELRVYYRADPSGSWSLLTAYTSDVSSWTKRTISLPNPSSAYQVAFEGTANYGYGVCIDDVAISGTASDPVSRTIRLTGDLAFGEVPVGTNATRVLNVHNDGDDSLTVSSIDYPDGFSGDWTSGTIASGALQTVTVTFAPIEVGSAGGTITVNSDASGGTNTITCSGTGASVTEVIPYAQGFENGGNMPYGWSRQYVTNDVDWTFQEGGPDGYPASAHNGSYNAVFYLATTIDENKTKLITPVLDFGAKTNDTQLTFWHYMQEWSGDQDELRVFYRTAPASSWTLLTNYTEDVSSWTQRIINLPNPTSTYQIAFEGNAKYGYGVCIDDVAITGIGPAPIIRLSGDLAFGNVPVGKSAKKTFTIHNDGDDTMTVTNISYPGGFSGNWSSGSIAEAAARTVTVTFSPVAVDGYGGTIAVGVGAIEGTNTTTCSGTGVVAYVAQRGPVWWQTREVLEPGAQTNDYAAANAGQLKWMASRAREELSQLSGGAGTNVNTMVDGFPTNGNFVVVNIGQVKAVAKPFYDRMREVDASIAYPWSEATGDDANFAAVNIGQLKNVFSFAVVDGRVYVWAIVPE